MQTYSVDDPHPDLWSICPACGAVVDDRELHTAWHAALDAVLWPASSTTGGDDADDDAHDTEDEPEDTEHDEETSR